MYVSVLQLYMPRSAFSAIRVNWSPRKPLQWSAARWLSSMRSSSFCCLTLLWISAKFWSLFTRPAQMPNLAGLWLDIYVWGRTGTWKTSTGHWCCAQSASLLQSGMHFWFKQHCTSPLFIATFTLICSTAGDNKKVQCISLNVTAFAQLRNLFLVECKAKNPVYMLYLWCTFHPNQRNLQKI